MTALKLSAAQLYRRCDASQFTFRDTSELPHEQGIIGQDRGTAAIEFGIEMHEPNFNIVVLGPDGSGRLTAVQHFINERVANASTPDDWCYVYNFENPHRPKAIKLPAGQAPEFKQDVEGLVTKLRTSLLALFESESFVHSVQQMNQKVESDSAVILTQIDQMAQTKGFIIQATPEGTVVILPLHEGKPMPHEFYDTLSDEEKLRIGSLRQEIEASLEKAYQATRALQMQADTQYEELRRNMAIQRIQEHTGEVLKKYDLYSAIIEYFKELEADLLNSLDEFEPPDPNVPRLPDEKPPEMQGNHQVRYKINVLVTHKPKSGAPVILLDLPTYQGLIGRIEHEAQMGFLVTDFTKIRAGALHEANGGYLIVRAIDILQHPFSWEALKRALSTAQIVIEDSDSLNPTINTTRQLQPDPIPLHLKVVLVASTELYYALYEADDRFRELFRVKADFTDMMPRNAITEQAYAEFIATQCHHNRLPHFDVEAVARIIDYGSWLCSDQNKLSAQFGEITPLIHESAFYARRNYHRRVMLEDVEQAIGAEIYRNNEIEEISIEQIQEGTIFIDVVGEVIGQVNALVVIQQGDYTFGLPSRLTARVFMGERGVLQLDRESDLTGPIHDKGMLILQGYLGGRYAQEYPLSVSATLTFEQSYGAIEGDSASSGELFALLSALSGFPIGQNLAVTGSVNQLGQIQPIGGATQKVEGFFKVCQRVGLTGTQGVIIPYSNIRHLMLSREVVEAVEAGQFHIYAIKSVDEGIAILTGHTAEEVHEAVDGRLRYLAEKLSSFE